MGLGCFVMSYDVPLSYMNSCLSFLDGRKIRSICKKSKRYHEDLVKIKNMEVLTSRPRHLGHL